MSYRFILFCPFESRIIFVQEDNMKKILIFLTAAVFIMSCGQWKVTSLKSDRLVFIPAGEDAGKVTIKTDEYALSDLSFGLGVFDDRICVSDNIQNRIQVLNTDGEPELIIGSLKNLKTDKLNTSRFNFSIIGSFTMDDSGNLYVQNRFSKKWNDRGDSREENNFSPSYILVFDSKGKLQYTLGQRGAPNLPFYYIEKLDIDESGRLFVISRSFSSWSVFRFTGKKRDFFCNLSKLEFTEKDDDVEYKGKIENVRMYRSGEKLLLSVAFYEGMRLKYRKLYNYIVHDNRLESPFMTIPDPKNVLFNIVDDKRIYFWNMELSDVKFMICNMEGNILTNIFLDIDKKNNYYSHIISDSSGKIYSYTVTKKGIDILEWE